MGRQQGARARGLGGGIHRAGRRHCRTGYGHPLDPHCDQGQVSRLERGKRGSQLQLARCDARSGNATCPARPAGSRATTHGHGSHTIGTMVGDDGGSNQVGVAPGAKWIGCRNMNAGDGTPAQYNECAQFFLAPTDLSGANPNPDLAPDVISNSWGCPASEGCTAGNEVQAGDRESGRRRHRLRRRRRKRRFQLFDDFRCAGDLRRLIHDRIDDFQRHHVVRSPVADRLPDWPASSPT